MLSSETQGSREEPAEFSKYPISNLEKDYKAIVSSSAFRRLQDKTQVFPLDKSDFVRIRLTHLMEVSTIARQLGIMITQNRIRYLPEEFKKNVDGINEKIPSVLSCAGLLHDLGNPPFGHFGEVVTGEWFQKEFKNDHFAYHGECIRDVLSEQMRKDLMHFEGNAWALRILSRISNKEGSHEINLTQGVISALIKYPTSSLQYEGEKKDIRKHKLGYFYAEQESFYRIAKETGILLSENDVARHPLAYLMEAADDIAYSTADLKDAYKKGLFTPQEFIEFFEKEMKGGDPEKRDKVECLLRDLKERLPEEERGSAACTEETYMVAFQNWMDFVKQWFMYCVA